MKLALISSIGKPTTPNSHGGQEIWAATFMNESVSRGNIFDLYAIKDSINIPGSVNLITIYEKGVDEIKKDTFFQNHNLSDIDRVNTVLWGKNAILLKENEVKYDFIIDSSGYILFSANAGLYKKPVIIIGHFPAEQRHLAFLKYFGVPKNAYIVLPSKFQYDRLSFIPSEHKFIIQHGIDITHLDFQTDNKTKLLWLGRIDPTKDKGLKPAILAAKKTNHPLQIYGNLENQEYYDQVIKPILVPSTEILYSLDKTVIFKDSKALLFPILWEEPFGLVMIESMACGTPVVAFARGSVPEVIKDGKTGFIVNPSDDDIRGNWIIKKTGIDGLCEAVERIYSMSESEYRQMRFNCRRHVEENFTVERMVDEYEKVYQKIISP